MAPLALDKCLSGRKTTLNLYRVEAQRACDVAKVVVEASVLVLAPEHRNRAASPMVPPAPALDPSPKPFFFLGFK